ncbi:DUF2975 domain-containing protein [Tissierella sp. MSJ-40]|uniref:DUF2975 domain-containing protein n=1 Tax=Tissierella simiarum TaxID=2841534 RepID=A0ABS6E9G7_9FIRM|nr:DUF2975 domain-containing protein [Tissierella simiarum]MBU5439582.1 DUF2975 domain-containing protein [Tissierella simiarum]
MKERISSKLLNGIVIVGITLTILALIATPLVITAFLKVSNRELLGSNMVMILTGCIYICAIPYLIALFKLKSICRLLCSENSFSPEIAKEFQIIAICGFSEAVLFILAELFLYFSCDLFLYALTIIPSIIVPFVSITAGFLSLLMSKIFKKAAEIKEEVDLTF